MKTDVERHMFGLAALYIYFLYSHRSTLYSCVLHMAYNSRAVLSGEEESAVVLFHQQMQPGDDNFSSITR